MKSFRTIITVISLSLQSTRRFSASAAKSSNSYTRTPQRGLSSSAVSGRSITSRMSSTIVGVDGMNQEFSLPRISEFRAEDVSFINSSVAKSIDDDLMFNDGSKIVKLP